MSDNLIPYPDINDKNFYNIINSKKEFNENKLKLSEISLDSCNKSTFKLFEHQLFIRNFFNENTPYSNLLLYHATGMGKTCSSILIAEANKNSISNIFVFLEKSVKQNYINEIYDETRENNQCTMDSYLNLQQNERNKIIKYNYQIKQLGKLTNEICLLRKTNIGRNKIKKIFSNSLIIIDEVHNIREYNNNEKEDCKRYSAIETILKYSENIKLVLMSATPIFDIPEEIVSITNLFLTNQKKEKITNNIFDKTSNLTKKGEEILKEKLRGIVSYVRGDNPITFPTWSFNKTNNSKYKFKLFKLTEIEMSEYQQEFYLRNSIQFNTNINILRQISNVYIGTKNIKDELKIENLQNPKTSISKKFYKLFENVNNSTGTNFIYSEFIGQGINLIKKMFLLNGFKLFNLKNKIDLDGKGLVIIDGNTDIIKRKQIIDFFNSIDNKDGKYIKILIGSSVLKEGITLKNVRNVHIMEPWHNMSRLYQIWGRAIRSCSHSELNENERNVKIFLYASIFNKDFSEIIPYDIQAYMRSENKEIKIKKVSDILRSIAIDCSIHKDYNQNIKDNITCIDNNKNLELDKSTYEINSDFFEKPNIITMINKIKFFIKRDYFFKLSSKLSNFTKLVLKELIPEKNVNLKNFKHLISINEVLGYIILRGNFLLFQPLNIINKKIQFYDRVNFSTNFVNIPFNLRETKEKLIETKNEEKKNKLKNINEELHIVKDNSIRGDYIGILLNNNTIKIKSKNDSRSKGRLCNSFNGNEIIDIINNIGINKELIKEHLSDLPRIRNKSGLCSILTNYFYDEVPVNLSISTKERKILDPEIEIELLKIQVENFIITLILHMNKHYIRITDIRLPIRTGAICTNKNNIILDEIIKLFKIKNIPTNINKKSESVQKKCNSLKKYMEAQYKLTK